MKTYKFEVVVTEGSNEFWKEVTANGKSGCDEVMAEIVESLVGVLKIFIIVVFLKSFLKNHLIAKI